MDFINEAKSLATQYSITTPIADQAKYFLQKIWQPLPPDHMVGLQAKKEYHQPYWFYSQEVKTGQIDHALKWAKALNIQGHAIYYNCVSRKNEVKQRSKWAKGTYEELRASSVIWCDIDSATDNTSLTQGLDVLLSFPLKPSFVVFSGGGLQAIWCLEELWEVDNEAKARDFRDWQLGFLKPRFAAAKFKFDAAIQDTTREMRLPGFVNPKPSRNNAVAHIVYESNNSYTIDLIKKYSLAPEPRRSTFFVPEKPQRKETNQYYVTGQIARYFFNGEIPEKGNRHNTARNISLQAAVCGVPQDLWVMHLSNLVRSWFVGNELHDFDPDNPIQAAEWAYNQIEDSGQADVIEAMLSAGLTLENAVFAVYIDENSFKQLESENLEKITEKIETVEDTKPNDASPSDTSVGTPKQSKSKRYTINAIREHIDTTIGDYVAGISPDNTPDNPNSVLLLKCPPGSGKTHASVNKLAQSEQPSAFLSLFKMDKQTGNEVFNHFGVNPDQAIFIEARNPNEQSSGYCHYTRQSEKLGNKGENIRKSLCYFCEYQTACEAEHYLSQFNKTDEYKILVARHNHGRIRSIMKGREIIVFDENPLDVVAEPVKVKLHDIRLPKLAQLTRLECENEIAIIEKVLNALKQILENQFPIDATVYPSAQNVKLGGRWLMDNLLSRCGIGIIEDFISYDKISKKAMLALTSGYRADNSLEAIDDSPPNFIRRFRTILEHEYNTFYKRNCAKWNSRLIPYGQELHIYEMQPFKLDRGVKVVVNDATSLPEYYGTAFTDMYGNPRITHIVEPALYPNATIIQYTGSDNTKTSTVRGVRRSKKEKRDNLPENENTALLALLALNLSETGGANEIIQESTILYELVETQTENSLAKDPNLNRCQEMIRKLSEKHNGSLLVVTYREFAIFLKQWAKHSGIINPDYIQWFGNLKGKNDYEHLESCLIFGTPRIPVLDLLIGAQIWNWKSGEPVNDAMTLKTEPFKGYIAPDGKTRARQYHGYVDPRVNKLYVHLIQSEIRQCYERIRPDSSTTEKFVYLDTAFPCTSYVTELVDRKLQTVQDLGETIFNEMLDTTGKVYRTAFCAELRKNSGCSEKTASVVYDKIVKPRLDLDLEIDSVKKKESKV